MKPYYLILPIWLAVFLAIGAFCLYAKNKQSMHHYYPIAISVLTWSSIGFFVANALFWLILYFLSLNGSSTLITSLLIGLLLAVGQIGASVIGFICGAFYGVLCTKKALAV
jgi:hypothetical protein